MDSSYPTGKRRHHVRSSVQHGVEDGNNDADDDLTDRYPTVDGPPSPKRQRVDLLGDFSALTGWAGQSISRSGTFRAGTNIELVPPSGLTFTHTPTLTAPVIGESQIDTGVFGIPLNSHPWNAYTLSYGPPLQPETFWPGSQSAGLVPVATDTFTMDFGTEVSHTLQHQHSFTPSQGSFGNVDDISEGFMYYSASPYLAEGDQPLTNFLAGSWQHTQNMTGGVTSGFHVHPQLFPSGAAQYGGLNIDRFEYLGLNPLQSTPVRLNSPNLSISPDPSTPERANPANTQWENVFASHGGPNSHTTSNRNLGHKRGYRKRQLQPEQRKTTKAMRQKGACLECFVTHAKCSPDDICEPCERRASRSTESPLNGQICIRNRLVDYEPLFDPVPLTSHLQYDPVKKFEREYVASWNDGGMETYVTEGGKYKSILLTTNFFTPADPEKLAISWLAKDENNGSEKFEKGYGLPLGLRDYSHEVLKPKCLEHIQEIVENGRDPKEASEGRMCGLGWKVLRAIERFFKQSSNAVNKNLLRNSLMLYAMHYFNSRTLTLTTSSLTSVFNHLPRPTQLPYKAIETSRLIGRQLKSAMQSCIRDTSRSVLKDLEHELRRGGKASWATSFCVIMILCMTAEMVQVAIDGLVVFLLGQEDKRFTRDTSRKIYSDLDEIQYRHCVKMFHRVYHTEKSNNGGTSSLFNPIKNGLAEDLGNGIDRPMVEFVEEIRGIVRTCCQEIKERAKPPTFDTYKEDSLEDHKAHHLAFRTKNAGRLVAKFLTSFAV